ncbi:MAG: hemolysin III family protein [Ketobacter sp.]|nr:hemolysin III family protein [Ketobacter sp.]MEC8811680.1 hemolysin III family protein [Pseudomonadota bacterium]
MYYGERLNSISHLIGAVLALVALGALLTISIQTGDPWTIIGFSVFGLSMVLLYTMSTLYHSFHPPHLKKLFKLLDHVSIYLLIAGSYTPFMLVSMREGNGLLILALVWGLAVIGILTELLLTGKAVKVGQMIIYVAMGWACTLDIDNVKAALPHAGYFWLLTGGIAYTVGIAFYLVDKLRWLNHAHGIWHFFVLVGSASHFIAIIGYVR